MKRPPQIWILAIGLSICLIPTVHSVRATSLIFGKTTTTTTTSAPTKVPAEVAPASVSPNPSEANHEADQGVTKPPLTGIPQIDYIWDPNLPRELNGYNLTDYPFYATVPTEIDFKCEGLHDGFYASVTHKCQVYHHCISDIRYDFLCANFTAFDQRTFICHFASEVDCVNSPKFFHRNDALYIALTTTTPSTTTTNVPTAPPLPVLPSARRPGSGGRRRRPMRRRPQYDYYYDDEVDEYDADRSRDDYYDEPRLQATTEGPRRRKRPRPNRRPEYEEYEYEDDRLDRRPTRRGEDRDRRPYDRREDERRHEDRRKKNKYDEDSEEDRGIGDRRRPYDEDRRRPAIDEDDYDRRPYDRRKPPRRQFDDYDTKEERKSYRPRKGDEEERRYRPKDPKPEERPEEDRKYRSKEAPKLEEPKTLVRPKGSGSIYDRPRTPPIIRRPVPKTERDKFDYKPSKTNPKIDEDEYYDDYETEVTSKNPRKSTPVVDSEERRGYSKRRPQNGRRPPVDFEEEELPRPKRPQDRRKNDERIPVVKIQSSDEQYDEIEEEKPKTEAPPRQKYASRNRETSSESSKEYKSEPIVRVVKRPFLPSRGGNPYSSRGLQPVGSKALDLSQVSETLQSGRDNVDKFEASPEEKSSSAEMSSESRESYQSSEEKYKKTSEETPEMSKEEVIKPVTVRPRSNFRNESPFRSTQDARPTTPKPKVPENYKNPLDINENEYDVTLNDALNPTLPNLPIRSSPEGFSNGRDSYSPVSYQRPRIINIDRPLLQASTEYLRTYVRPQAIAYQSSNYRQPILTAGQYYGPY